jgi:hypothetical protein
MTRVTTALVALVLCASQGYGQTDIPARIAQLEALAQQQAKDVAAIKADVGKINDRLAVIETAVKGIQTTLSAKAVVKPMDCSGGCQCGCLTGGVCTCLTKAKTDTVPWPTTSYQQPTTTYYYASDPGTVYYSDPSQAGIGACANGQCGTSGGVGFFRGGGLFGRRR